MACPGPAQALRTPVRVLPRRGARLAGAAGRRPAAGVPADAVPALPRRDGLLRHAHGHAVLVRPLRRLRHQDSDVWCPTTSTTSRGRSPLPPALHAEHRAPARRAGPRAPPLAPHRPHRAPARSRDPDAVRRSHVRGPLEHRLRRVHPRRRRRRPQATCCASPRRAPASPRRCSRWRTRCHWSPRSNAILNRTHQVRDCALFIDLPDQGWTMWGRGHRRPVLRTPPPAWPTITLPGTPAALLAIHTDDDVSPDPALMEMLAGLVPMVRPAIDQYLARLPAVPARHGSAACGPHRPPDRPGQPPRPRCQRPRRRLRRHLARPRPLQAGQRPVRPSGRGRRPVPGGGRPGRCDPRQRRRVPPRRRGVPRSCCATPTPTWRT